MAALSSLTPDAVQYLVHHVALPSKLPQKNDSQPAYERALIATTIKAVCQFRDALENKQAKQQVDSIRQTIETLGNIRDEDGMVNESRLRAAFAGLISGKLAGMITIEIKAQNAGILVRRHNADIVFEVFELSPSNNSIFATAGRLQRSFPAYAASIAVDGLQEKGLVVTLAQTICKMSHQAAAGFQPQVRKSRQDHDEDRDTTRPEIVTELLMNVLTALGRSITVPVIWKNTREDVLWKDCLQPWRRSPLWLLIRVSMQLHFSRLTTGSGSLYKPFTVFHLSRILDLARKHHDKLGKDMLYSVAMKLSRRMFKLKASLGFEVSSTWVGLIEESILTTSRQLEADWNLCTAVSQHDTDRIALQGIRPENDLNHDLPLLDDFLDSISCRVADSGGTIFQSTSKYLKFSARQLPSIFGSGEDAFFNLVAVEAWVEHNLHEWLHENIDNEDTCAQLRELLQCYHRKAKSTYTSIPESLSIMYLTILELWVACDTLACHWHQLLTAYDPELPIHEFQSLLLPRRTQLERLDRAERYIHARQVKVQSRYPSVFRDFGNDLSFAVQHYDRSSDLKSLRGEIERDAAQEKEEKRGEFDSKRKEYQRLMRQYDESACDEHEVIVDRFNGYTAMQHHPRCKRCGQKKIAEDMLIQIHEWPLPTDLSKLKAIVFELKTPAAFSHWRDVTFYVLRDVLGLEPTQRRGPVYQHRLSDDHGLSQHFTRTGNTSQRIILLSQIKPHMTTHRRFKQISSAQIEQVCLNNGVNYQLYDNWEDCFTMPLSSTNQVVQDCSYQMPKCSSSLQIYILRTPAQPSGVSPNEVIATQAACPDHLSLDEYKAFGLLPLGQNVQYLNIAAQLAMPALDFSKIEAQMLIRQTIHQAGPPSESGCIERSSHHILTDQRFGIVLLRQLTKSLSRIKKNWESWRALASYIQLVLRLLDLAKSNRVQTTCLEFLISSRQVCLDWLDVLRKRIQASTNDKQRTQLESRTVEIALVAITTFDVGNTFLEAVLSNSKAASELLRCAIAVQEREASIIPEDVGLHHAMMQFQRSLMHRAFDTLRLMCCEDTSLSKAVMMSWSAFRPTAAWTQLKVPQDHWLTMTSESGDTVHYNILTGELLVNGLPVALLPKQYTQHPMYQALFGNASLQTVPTKAPGMDFSIQQPYQGFDLAAGMHGPDFLLRAMTNESHFDLVPARVLYGALPVAFVEDMVHWYDHHNNTIEFRPTTRPWSSDTGLWRLAKYGSHWRLIKSGTALLNCKGESSVKVLENLSAIEDHAFMHIVFDISTKTLDVDVPRLQLSFHREQGGTHLKSRQYRGMIVDPNQDIGTLYGLLSKLVLRHESKHTVDRMLLIPEGSIQFTKAHDHVNVSIAQGSAERVNVYSIDTVLGRLKDDGSLQSKLMLAYLHALTSACIPDVLTEHTGTETAISILRSGAVRSFAFLTEKHMSLLKAIASITPARCFYPRHERVMQQVKWDSRLPFISQHPYLYTLVKEIFDQARNQKAFYPAMQAIEPPDLNFVDETLLQRDLIRSSMYRISGFGAEQFSTQFDNFHRPRDQGQNSPNSTRSYIAATLVLRNQAVLHWNVDQDSLQAFRSRYFDGSIVHGPFQSQNRPKLTYDGAWLVNPSEIVPTMWMSLNSSLASDGKSFNQFDIMMWLSTLAFAEQADPVVVQALVALYRVQDFSTVTIPLASRFDLREGDCPDIWTLETAIQRARLSFREWSNPALVQTASESNAQFQVRRQKVFQSKQDDAIKTFANALNRQWPCERPSTPTIDGSSMYINVVRAMAEVFPLFKTWFDNRLLAIYLNQIFLKLGQQPTCSVSRIPVGLAARGEMPVAGNHLRYVDAKTIFNLVSPEPPIEPSLILPTFQSHGQPTSQAEHDVRLASICQMLDSQAHTDCEKDYVLHLRQSFAALQQLTVTAVTFESFEIATKIKLYSEQMEHYVLEWISKLQKAANVTFSGMTTSNVDQDCCVYTHLLPRLSPTFFLNQLNNDQWAGLPSQWKMAIALYGVAITKLHRARRLLSLSGNPTELAGEFNNVGHTNWDPHDYPESLLLEVESGVTIREVQEDIASQMRHPPGDRNTAMQLNMGEGKSSIIVPVIAAFLANGTMLVRVLVAKPQSHQMLEMLITKLGGLLNRRIYHLPFSRALRLNQSQAQYIGIMIRECRQNRGILLVQPEHLLSLQLMGLECLISGKEAIGRSLIDTQCFFSQFARDIVDESDENFSVKFELVYTMGSQQPIQMSPERWSIINAILGLAVREGVHINTTHQTSIELSNQDLGRVPRLRTLQQDGSATLMDGIARHICTIGFPGFPITRQPQAVRDAVLQYITKPDLTNEEILAVENGNFWTESTRGILLLLRGLIACGVLPFAYGSKRWRVNYGLDLVRTPGTKLAVPFRSKDNPSPRSEFSHPDVVIVLTSLTYYYAGLDDEDLFIAFDHLIRSDQPEAEYSQWVNKDTVPEAFHHLGGINIKDRFQCVEQIFPTLRYSKGVIDYFLSRIVFPKEMKEFPNKLSASGWDIGQIKSHPLTGFSGTNDSRHVLPLSVEYLDLPKQQHTNALVLAYLLQDENSVEVLRPRPSHIDSEAEHLISVVNMMETQTRVILDVGAQILELNNYQVAKKWLNISDQAATKAVVYFNEAEELSVLDRNDRVEALQVSPFAQHLGACLIYLDEAHTRGTDLRLPNDYRAAVTLGANLTKDRLVQACMRLRKLGKGQSVVFCVPKEIKTKILELNLRPRDTEIDVSDVLCWAISETWVDLRRSMPLWATQGQRFEKHKNLLAHASITKEEAEKFLEDEAQSLELRYRPKMKQQNDINGPNGWDLTNTNVSRIVERCRAFGAMNFSSATLQEEQERELSPEIQAQRQIERPFAMKAERHSIHNDLKFLIKTGRLKRGSLAFLPAFSTLKTTTAAQGSQFDLADLPSELLVTADYARTVKHTIEPYVSDSYQRPIQWILSVPDPSNPSLISNLIILSPFEANTLLPSIRQAAKVTLHLYSPRPNILYTPLDDLNFYTVGAPFAPSSIPRTLTVQLNLFAGQLYLRSYAEYIELCDFLGLAYTASGDGEEIAADGFRLRRNHGVGGDGESWGLKSSPVQFLKVLMTKIRRDCEGIERTHMGRILEGVCWRKEIFERVI